MKPVNSKSLFVALCATMDRLDNNEIDVAHASAIKGLASEARCLLKYELDRAKITGKPVREIEPKGFDDTTHIIDNN